MKKIVIFEVKTRLIICIFHWKQNLQASINNTVYMLFNFVNFVSFTDPIHAGPAL